MTHNYNNKILQILKSKHIFKKYFNKTNFYKRPYKTKIKKQMN